MKKNKIISCLLVAVLCFCLTVPASASNNLDINIDTEIERALNNETDLELDYTPVTTNPSTGKRPSLSDRYVGLEGRGINASNRGKVCRRHPNSNQFVIGDGEYSDGWHSYVASSSVTINKKERLSLTVKTEYF